MCDAIRQPSAIDGDKRAGIGTRHESESASDAKFDEGDDEKTSR